VKDGQRFGIPETDIFHDENLAAMCNSCNSGLSSDTVPLRFLAAALIARINNTCIKTSQLNNGAPQHNTQQKGETR
jgi:hypothetical protein